MRKRKKEKLPEEESPTESTESPPSEPSTYPVKILFARSKTRPYLFTAFCLFAKVNPDAKMNETKFEKKLKKFLERRI